MLCNYKIILSVLIIFVVVISGQNQQQNTNNVDNIIGSVFSTPSTVPGGTTRRGFVNIVTPEPILDPTQEPQVFVTEGNRCVCVPYHLCDPTTNATKTETVVDGAWLIDIRFNPDSCQDVLDVCCAESNRPIESGGGSTSTTVRPRPRPPVTERPKPTGCGYRNVGGIDFQITGNFRNEAGFGEFPWTVALIQIKNNECLCGGSLIHPQIVLTGSHCVRNIETSNLKVRAGEWDTQTTKERLPYQEQVAQTIITHPLYNSTTLANDIALIVLQQPFQLADHINVACLPPQNYDSTGQVNCYASGWGKDVFGKAGKYSVIMKRVPLPIVPNNRCQSILQRTRLGSLFRLDPSFICAGGQEGIDTCEGDGGAPLVCPIGDPTTNRFSQSGIVAWGIGCNEPRPAVYANVALARNWIDEQVRGLGYDPSVYTY